MPFLLNLQTLCSTLPTASILVDKCPSLYSHSGSERRVKLPFELENALYVVLYGPDFAHLSELDSCFALYLSPLKF